MNLLSSPPGLKDLEDGLGHLMLLMKERGCLPAFDGLQIFHLFDPSGTGFMTFQAFVAVSGSITNHEDHEHHMKLASDACHLDKDGHILYTQLERNLRLSMPSIPNSMVQKWFHKLDFNGNGFITWEELRVFLEQNPELLPIFMVATFHE
ncbi:unnamed protein product [Sphagnum balticum]